MEIAPIFEHFNSEECLLFSMFYKEEAWNNETVIDWYLEFWSDPERIRDFIKEHKELFNTAYWKQFRFDERTIVRQIKNEADEFFKMLFSFHEQFLRSPSRIPSDFYDLFKPLHEYEQGGSPFQYKAKASSGTYPPLLRLYGIQLASKQMLITGGGIKLTATMSEMPELVEELQRIDAVKRFVQQNDISSAADFLLFS